jgi:uncharacterized protein (TIGR00251 family)
MAAWYRWQGEDLLLTLRIQPRASRDEIAGPYGEALKVRITAPPVDGKANAHLLRFLAELFGVSPSSVELISGETGRDKRVKITRPQRLPDGAEITPK